MINWMIQNLQPATAIQLMQIVMKHWRALATSNFDQRAELQRKRGLHDLLLIQKVTNSNGVANHPTTKSIH